MCLYLKEEHQLEILKQDLTVYKFGRIEEDGFSPAWKGNFRYKTGELTDKVELKAVPMSSAVIKQFGLEIYKYVGMVEEGYHAFIGTIPTPIVKYYRDLARERGIIHGYVLGKFTIPKGTKAYRTTHEVVAEQMIYNG